MSICNIQLHNDDQFNPVTKCTVIGTCGSFKDIFNVHVQINDSD